MLETTPVSCREFWRPECLIYVTHLVNVFTENVVTSFVYESDDVSIEVKHLG
jgi:hypothetical protein